MVVRELFAKLGLLTDDASFAQAESKIAGLKDKVIGFTQGMAQGMAQGMRDVFAAMQQHAPEAGKGAGKQLAEHAQKGIEEGGRHIDVKKALLGLVGAGFGIKFGADLYDNIKRVGEKVAHLTGEVANEGYASIRGAQRVGITTEAYEELGYAAVATGGTVESMEHSLRFLNRAIDESRQGSFQMAYEFGRIGVSLHGVKTADEALMRLADGFQRMPDGAAKSALAMRIFGRAGTEMLPVLNQGSEGVAKLRAQAHLLGVVMSKEDEAATKKYVETTKKLKMVAQGLRRNFIAPFIAKAADSRENLFNWVLAHAETILPKVRAFGTQMANSVEAIAHGWIMLGQFILRVARAIVAVADSAGLATPAILVLAAASGLLLAKWHPWIVLLTVLSLLLEEVWGWITGKRSTLLGDHFGPWKDFKKKYLDPILTTFEDIKSQTTDLFGGLSGDSIKQEIAKIKEGIKSLFTPDENGESYFGNIKTAFISLGERAGQLWQDLKGPLLEIWQASGPLVTSFFTMAKQAWGLFADVIKGPIGGAIVEFLRVEMLGILKIIKGTIEEITALFNMMAGAFYNWRVKHDEATHKITHQEAQRRMRIFDPTKGGPDQAQAVDGNGLPVHPDQYVDPYKPEEHGRIGNWWHNLAKPGGQFQYGVEQRDRAKMGEPRQSFEEWQASQPQMASPAVAPPPLLAAPSVSAQRPSGVTTINSTLNMGGVIVQGGTDVPPEELERRFGMVAEKKILEHHERSMSDADASVQR